MNPGEILKIVEHSFWSRTKKINKPKNIQREQKESWNIERISKESLYLSHYGIIRRIEDHKNFRCGHPFTANKCLRFHLLLVVSIYIYKYIYKKPRLDSSKRRVIVFQPAEGKATDKTLATSR